MDRIFSAKKDMANGDSMAKEELGLKTSEVDRATAQSVIDRFRKQYPDYSDIQIMDLVAQLKEKEKPAGSPSNSKSNNNWNQESTTPFRTFQIGKNRAVLSDEMLNKLTMPSNTNNTSENASHPEFPLYDEQPHKKKDMVYLEADQIISETARFMKNLNSHFNDNSLPDTIFFLDKSARPVAHLVRKLFNHFYPNKPIPKIRFVDIGTEKAGQPVRQDIAMVGEEDAIRKTYGKNIDQNSSILVVDEYSNTGKSLSRAADAITRAFPNARVAKQVAYSETPKWYKNPDYLGIREISTDDIKGKAIYQVNSEFKTDYSSLEDLESRGENDHINFFYDIYKTSDTSVTHVIRTIPVLNTETEEYTQLRKEKNKKLNAARLELDRMAKKIISLDQNVISE